MYVYCSASHYAVRPEKYYSAQLRYIPLNANGIQSILYDSLSLFSACRRRCDVILLLGVSGAVALPFVRLISSARIVTNVDGIEWRRDKWKGIARMFLRFSERLAVRCSQKVIADNDCIAEYIEQTYDVGSEVIAYGGDHAVLACAESVSEYDLPEEYAFSVCRIEPENNVDMVLRAFAEQSNWALVIVGNWGSSQYGRSLLEKYCSFDNIYMLNPIYELGKLKTLRSQAGLYVHGHSAGGTNPSLVEAMHFGRPVLAFDCGFNRSTTENKAYYFRTWVNLQQLLESIDRAKAELVGDNMLEIARRRYTWKIVAQQYFSLLSA